ncbi:MAG TPA: amidohydrolase [Candidatus Ruthenibacterium avium]|uniref:Amidohydrolase n=1 Tax=Candidatus Ruthenibacterium avium TaxID=2838751 RepID=A0A9D2M1K6_9FIRM|nr:amidohydrolase [Candidatus Ruthenibacterium avium]
MQEYLSRCRRALHQIPEVDFDLPKTLQYLKQELEPLGFLLFSPAKSALCAWIDAGKGEAVAFRADMDALPTQEKNDCSYRSAHEGKMHACGHDGHMAMVLALAKCLAECKERLKTNVLLVFQPAEETTGGAKLICESGVFEQYHVRAIYGFHLWPGFQAGEVVSRPGPLLAKASEVTVTVRGKAAHIARAQEGLDALMAAAHFLTAMEQRMETEFCPKEPCLLRFGKMESGAARNAVSAQSVLMGTMRVFSQQMFEKIRAAALETAAQVEAATGCTFELDFTEGYPPVCNEETLWKNAVQKLPHLTTLPEPLLIAEDFSFYQQRIPGLFLLLGTGRDVPLHSDRFDFDETALSAGLDVYLRLLDLQAD